MSDASKPPLSGRPSLSVKDVCEAIWEAERELELLDWEVRGVRVWQALRAGTAKRLSIDAETVRPPRPAAKLSKKLRQPLTMLRGSLGHNPFRGRETFDELVFESPRTTTVNGQRICIYTADLVRELDAKGIKFAILERSGDSAHSKDRDDRRVHLDGIELLGALRRRMPMTLGAADLDRVRALERFLLARLEVDLPMREQIERYVPQFRTIHALYRRLFAKRRPRRLYCVCAYGRLAPMIKAARDEHVESIELQHGGISRYHLGYSFPVRPKRCTLEYLPDIFWSWGPRWNPPLDWAFDRDRIVDRGFPHFERNRARYAGIRRQPGSIVVLSQQSIGEQIAKRLLEQIDAFAGREIFYKLHPGEYATYRAQPSLSRLAEHRNVHICSDVDLYELFAKAETMIGVCSTAIYEGIQFGCATVLMPLRGIERMADLLESGRAEPFDTFVARLRNS